MKPLNYCRQLEKWLKRHPYGWLRQNVMPEDAIEASLSVMRQGIKFSLPPGGMSVDLESGREILSSLDELNMPYQDTVLEYSFDFEPDNPKNDGKVSVPKRITAVSQLEGYLYVSCFWFYRHSSGLGYWQAVPTFRVHLGEMLANLARDEKMQYAMLRSSQRCPIPREEICEELAPVASFMAALACNNVSVSSIPAKGKGRKSALPYDDYHYLSVKTKGKSGSGEAMEGRSPREHTRRGHVRRYSSGNMTWIPHTIVNPGVGGKITKEYVL